MSSGGADIAAQLDEVTAGASTPQQTTVKLGQFQAPATGSWANYIWVPLRDSAGELARVSLGGERTLRFTTLPGNLNFDYLMLKPAGAEPLDLSPIRPLNMSASIPLEAGRKYYLEALMKEGTGGENLAVAWRKPGDLPLQNGDPPIPGAFLSSTGSVDPGTIVGQPESRTVDEFGSVSFTVALSGTPPFDYQWYQNDVPINAASGPILTIAAAAFADNQAQFRVRAGNGISSQLSDAALLKVVPDLTPPALLAAEGSPSLDRVTLRFSEPIEAADALEPSHYAIDGGFDRF